jgi:hypothetical protein
MNAAYFIRKKSGDTEEFSKKKLEYSLICAGSSRDQANRIASQIHKSCSEGYSTKRIYNEAFKLLKKESKILASQYSMTKAISELGPNGYHFEKFITSVFRGVGFKASSNHIKNGRCVKHEIDVIAHKGKQTIYTECKFHNSPSTKNDLKVALYVKARYLDLIENPENDLSEFWLISNTKFSKDAIQYSECAGLTLVGPNYPARNALADMTKKSKVYPVTALTTLKKAQARLLLKDDIVLIYQIQKDPSVLKKIGLDLQMINKVLIEIEGLKRANYGN